MKAIAVIPEGLEEEGLKELESFGANSLKRLRRAVSFEADLACFYRLQLNARLPFRILREISRFHCNGPTSLYQNIQKSFDWETWLNPSISFKVDVSGSCNGLPHSHFTALQVKNALIDFQREIWGARSNINLQNPDLCIHLHLNNQECVLSLDGSGDSLHRRGYRAAMGAAPLKENLAAGLVRITNWSLDIPLVDPFCGSGTFLIEALSDALNIAPGLNRTFLFEAWVDFDQRLWKEEYNNARKQQLTPSNIPPVIGCEQNIEIANQAKVNIKAAGLEHMIDIQIGHFKELTLPSQKGIILCNPPYGKRLGRNDNLSELYKQIGSFCKQEASGWTLWLLNGNPELSSYLGMKASCKIPINNGGIDCRWLQYNIR